MYYEINVSQNGKHFFATHARSIPNKEYADKLMAEFVKRFPFDEGFRVDCTRWELTGTPLAAAGAPQ